MSRKFSRSELEDMTRDELTELTQGGVAELSRRGLRETEGRESQGRVRDAVDAAVAQSSARLLDSLRGELDNARKEAKSLRTDNETLRARIKLQLPEGTVAAKWAVFHRTAAERGWPSGEPWKDSGIRAVTRVSAQSQWEMSKNTSWQETDIRLVEA